MSSISSSPQEVAALSKRHPVTLASSRPYRCQPTTDRDGLQLYSSWSTVANSSGAAQAWLPFRAWHSRVQPSSTRGKNGGMTWGVVIKFGGVCYQDTYPMYLACIAHVSCMFLDVSRSYTSRYIKIHQDTFVSVALAIIGNVYYLGICILLYMYDVFRIHSRYK